MIKIHETGVVFQNPLPSVVPLQAQFPGFCKLAEDDIICVYKRGTAMGAVETDYALTRSSDGGLTWKDEGVIWDRRKDDRPYSYGYGYPALLDNGDLLLAGYRWDRSKSDADFNIYHPTTLGAVHCDTVLFRSKDKGHTWSRPAVVPPPSDVAMVNTSGRIVKLRDGRLMLPMESWKAWDDAGPIKQRSLVAFSKEGGETWGDHTIVAMDPTYRVLHWNGMFSRIGAKRILAMYWGKDTKTEQDLTIPATYSEDEGQTWRPTYDTGLVGQMGCSIDAGAGRALAIFNRRDEAQPGVWAALSNDGGDTWPRDPRQGHTCLWDARGRALFGSLSDDNRSRSIYDEGTMAFGKPDVIHLGGNRYLAGFWVTANFVMHVRFARLTIE